MKPASTSTVVLQLEAEGELDLDDKVDKWLPDRACGNGDDGREITIRQLLNHNSGIFNYGSNQDLRHDDSLEAAMPVGSRRSQVLAFLGVLTIAGVMMLAIVAFRGAGDEQFVRSVVGMEAFARTMQDGDRLGSRTVGEMEFEEIRRERGVVFFQQGEPWGRPYGYAWSPQGDPARIFEDVEWSEDHVDHHFEHLHGAFYSWQGRR
ncbi:serine hydrolase domain-containing protein [Nonomuraea sp. NPDC050310]|uniref:serine hydrolase domain-containing protein n=1 Tax=Nonomuraea sp. NPDC050310 TaxID=3154935 RepID=UPI0033E7D975